MATLIPFSDLVAAFRDAGFTHEGGYRFRLKSPDGTFSYICKPAPDGNVNVTAVLQDIDKQMPLLAIQVRHWLSRNMGA